MPELPEVETVRRGLAPHLEGARLVEVRQNRPDLRFPFPEDFAARLTGARVERLERRAKYLVAPLDTGETLVAHLGMTGRFTVEAGGEGAILRQAQDEVGGKAPDDILRQAQDEAYGAAQGEVPRSSVEGAFYYPAGGDPKHTHLVLWTDRGVRVAFNDARRFGYMDLIATSALDSHPYFHTLGPEPLSDAFGARVLEAAFAGRRQSVKATLLDQRVVAGLGNIYVSEALHRARLHPERPAGEIKRAELKRLVEAIKAVLAEAIVAGGSTLRDYRSADGELGYFQHSFKVYGREEDPCASPKCRGVVRRLVQGGRSTFFCATCQR